jgi:GNAT superfamily N-acetyltransferase
MGRLWAVNPLSCPGCPRAAQCLSTPTWLAESMTSVHHLADDTRVMIRPLLPSDRAAVAAGFESLTPRSRRLRFFSSGAGLSEAQLDYLVNVDYRNHFALAAFALDESGQPGIGVARFIRLADRPSAAEAAVTVLDSHQGRGVGTLLLAELAGIAQERGIGTFVAYVLTENAEWLSYLREIGAETFREEPGVTRVEFALDAVSPESRARQALRRLVDPPEVTV